MNEQFYGLPEEKRQRIINAGLEIFAKNDYKHAVMDEIAKKADISKGLLFYYFHNKRGLYLFLNDYCGKLILDQAMDQQYGEITDFFELLEHAAERKMKVLEKAPYLMNFIMRCYYADDSAAEPDMNKEAARITSGVFGEYFKNVDCGKFREDVEPMEIYQMLTWMMDGYIHDRQRRGETIRLQEVMEVFYLWEQRIKRAVYKEEYLE